jgi:hypothetical protein
MSKDVNARLFTFVKNNIMTIVTWMIRGLIMLTFLYSGACKSLFDETKLVAMGQTGVEGLSPGLIRFTGIAELAGVLALLLPVFFPALHILVPASATGLGIIMLPASVIHYRRGEPASVALNIIVLCCCIFLAFRG